MTNDEINAVFGITESFQLPDKLMAILMDSRKRTEIFEKFKGEDLKSDLFTLYFQEQHSNRDKMMQDFTPPEVCRVVTNILGDFSTCLDVCAGTGGLTIAAWSKNPDCFFYAEELSERAFPILLFNLAIRNMQGVVLNKDVLSGEFKKGFRLHKGERYSEIEQIFEEPKKPKVDAVIMNPPYSLKHVWEISDERFDGYPLPPTKASDYAFILHGLYYLADHGTLVGILPHGVLFRGNTEGIIREKLIGNQVLNAIIGLPEKLFLNTGIPVCVLVCKRNSNNVLFIDASRQFEKNAKLNVLRAEDVERIEETFEKRSDVKRYAALVNFKTIEKNEFNLNIPRYVDTYEPPPPIELDSVLDEIEFLKNEIEQSELALTEMLKDLTGNSQDSKLIDKTRQVLKPKKKVKKDKYDQISIFDIYSNSGTS